jgi:putative phosphoribosyl transferase
VEPPIVFADRVDAGRRLAERLRTLELDPETLVCGIPRGGVAVAAEVARVLGLPLRAVVARKVGAPGHAELAIGAVGPDGTVVLDEALCRQVGATETWLEGALARARAEVAERVSSLPAVVDAAAVRGRTVLVVDDGVATGATAAAVGRWLGDAGAARRVLALPCGPQDTLARLRADYEEVLAVSQPASFVAVGQWYRSFTQTTDAEVEQLLRHTR